MNTQSVKNALISCIFLVASFANAGEGRASKNKYHLFNPTPKDEMRELITDRPDKTESPITVDAGHFSIETDLVILTMDQSKSVDGNNGFTTLTKKNTASFNVMNLKFGITNCIDFQTIVETYTLTSTNTNGVSAKKKGFGDTTLRLKINLIGNEGDPVALGMMPVLKLPTNQDKRTNKKVEPGIIFPASVALPHDISMGFMFQWNRIKNDANDAFHNQMISSITFGHDIVGDLAGYAEFFSQSSDEVGANWVGTADFGLTYGLSSDIQLDTGINLGISEAADDYNPFLGITVRI